MLQSDGFWHKPSTKDVSYSTDYNKTDEYIFLRPPCNLIKSYSSADNEEMQIEHTNVFGNY